MKQLEFYKIHMWAANQLGGMCSTATALFSIIYSYHESTGECFMSLSEFAKRIGCSRSTVQLAIDKLKKTRVIHVTSSEFRNSNQYSIDEKIIERWKAEYNCFSSDTSDFENLIKQSQSLFVEK